MAALITAIASVIIGVFTLIGVIITSRRTKTATNQVIENNGWAKTNTKTLEAFIGEWHEFRGEVWQRMDDHERDHPPKKRKRG